MRGFESDGVNLMAVIPDDSNDRQSVFVYLLPECCRLLPGSDKSTVRSIHCEI